MHLLDNPAWAALTTLQAPLSRGGTLARRYVDDVAPIGSVSEPTAAAMEELTTLLADGDTAPLVATLEGLVPLVTAPLSLVFTKTLVQMVCPQPRVASSSDIEMHVLSDADVPETLALTALTQPGPFRPRTHTLGTYLGIRVNGVLAAMGGQRMHLPGYREVSAVCTHPDFTRRGYARAIVARLVDLSFEQGFVPFLHLNEDNHRAQSLYAGLGFVERARLPVLVVAKERPS